MVKLPGNNQVEYIVELPEDDNNCYERGVKPPDTAQELLQQVRTMPESSSYYTPFIPTAEISLSSDITSK